MDTPDHAQDTIEAYRNIQRGFAINCWVVDTGMISDGMVSVISPLSKVESSTQLKYKTEKVY